MRNKINKYRDVILLTIGTLLVILSLCLLFYDRFELLKTNVFDEIELEKYRENNKEETTDSVEDEDEVEAQTDTIEDEEEDNSPNPTPTPVNKKDSVWSKVKKEFIGYLEIKKINLKQGFLSLNSSYNNVKYKL